MSEHRRTPFNLSRLAWLAVLIGVSLAAVHAALAANEQDWVRHGPAALAYLLGGFLVAAVLNAVGAALAQAEDHVARIEDAAYAQTEAAEALTRKIDEAMKRSEELDARETVEPGLDLGPSHDGGATAAMAIPVPAMFGTNGPPRQSGYRETPDDVVAAALRDEARTRLRADDDAPPAPEAQPDLSSQEADARSLEPAPHAAPAAEPPSIALAPTDPPEPAVTAGSSAAAPEAEPAPEPPAPADMPPAPVAMEPLETASGPVPIDLPDFADTESDFVAAQERVQERLSAHDWSGAVGEAEFFARLHPDHAEGRQLVTRARRQQEMAEPSVSPFQSSPAPAAAGGADEQPGRSRADRPDDAGYTVALDPERADAFDRFYERVQRAVDQRHWRDALEGARQLVSTFPGHPRAVSVGHQIPTLQENADIEERREHEMHIEALIRARRFAEAATQAEDVVARFPGSPQAKSLDKLLPRLRDLAARSS